MLHIIGNEEKWVAFSRLLQPSRAAQAEQYLQRGNETTWINIG